MKVFIWERLNQLTYNYHSGGGLMVVEETEALARKLAHEDPNITIPEDADPDHVFEVVGGAVPRVVVFEDAGCC